MPKSDRDQAVLAREREARLAAQMAREFLRSGAVPQAMEHLLKALNDPACPKRTRARVAQCIIANAARITSKSRDLRLDGRQVHLSMADLLALEGGAILRPEQPGVHTAPPTLADPASDAGPEGLLGSGVAAQPPTEGGFALPNNQGVGPLEHTNDTPEHLLLLAPSCRPKPPEVVQEPRCPGCGAITEPGHLAACPVPREFWPDSPEGGPQDV